MKPYTKRLNTKLQLLIKAYLEQGAKHAYSGSKDQDKLNHQAYEQAEFRLVTFVTKNADRLLITDKEVK